MHAFILSAYQKPEVISEALSIYSALGPCYLHLDRAAHLDAYLPEWNRMHNVLAESRYRTNWGSIYHLEALLRGIRLLLSDRSITHFHLISAQDFPTVSMKDFTAFFEGDDRIWLQNLVTADYPELTARYTHYYFMHLINYRDMGDKTQNLIGRLDRLQDLLHIHRNLVLPRKGMVYGSLPREAAAHALQCTELLKKLRFTYIPEEFFFQNAFFDTPYEEKVTGKDLRFSIWDNPSRGLPAYLDLTDLPSITSDGHLFCRKVIDPQLIQVLKDRWFAN